MVRVRIQNVRGPVGRELTVDNSEFRLVGSSAAEYSPFEHSCGFIRDELSLALPRGGAGEGNVCFETSPTVSNLVLRYEPRAS